MIKLMLFDWWYSGKTFYVSGDTVHMRIKKYTIKFSTVILLVSDFVVYNSSVPQLIPVSVHPIYVLRRTQRALLTYQPLIFM